MTQFDRNRKKAIRFGLALLLFAACADEAELNAPFEDTDSFDQAFDGEAGYETLSCDQGAIVLEELLAIISPDKDGDSHWEGLHDSLVVNQLTDGVMKLRLEIGEGAVTLATINSYLVTDCSLLDGRFDPETCFVGPNREATGTGCQGFQHSSGLTGECYAINWSGIWDKNFASGGGKVFSMPVKFGTLVAKGGCMYAEGHGLTKDDKSSKVSLFDVEIKGIINSPDYVSGIYRANLESKFFNSRIGTDGDRGQWYMVRDKLLFE